ncbi:zinc finger BED domain-containing protein RICESLEEPER 2-like [Quercus suber]|uniref:zinc finger BED domain-containing protein RICESLEEPER 2-like n=1 Tax=Quercus suber TaxID=58331 RepID=UPI000CE1CA5E|nr:zinc finger BED domain-containing protein RICESLEEPER 2-like [Quercus suber]
MAEETAKASRIEKFNGANFGLWRMQIEDYLYGKKLHLLLLGKKLSTMKDDEWTLLNRQVLGVIRLTLSRSVAHNVLKEKTTIDLMKALSGIYEKSSANNKVHLMKKLFNLKMADNASIAQHLNDFNTITNQQSTVKIDFDDEIRALLVLASLSNNWKAMRIAVMEPSSDAPPSQTTPAAQADPVATPTNAETLPPKPNNKTKVSEIVADCGNNRKKSTAWDHFEKIKISEGQFKAVCHYCQKTYRANSKGHGTTNLLNHTPNCVKNPNRASLKGQKTLALEPKMNGEEGFQLVPTAFIIEASRKALAEMIIIDELPFRFVEGYGFQRYSTTLQPKLQIRDIPSRQTVARDVIGIYGVEREKLRGALKGRRVCLTTDTWTSIQNLNYMSLTGHFIDDDWNLHNRILNFCQVEDHREETIGRKIEMCLREWGVDGIFTLIVDNASSNGTTIKFLQTVTKDWKGTVLEHEFLHMRCCAHILNLIVGDGLKEIDASIARVHEAVRWNSTYLMLDTAENFEKVFLRMEFEDDSYSSYFLNKENSDGLGSPCGVDFQNCRTFVGFLKLFYNATKKFSGSLYVTSNTFFDEMKKMRFLKFSFSEIYGDEVADEMIDLVGEFMGRLYDDYSRVDSPNVVLPSENERTHMEGDTIGCSDPYAMVNSRYEQFLEAEKSIGCSNEIEKYLAENCESRRDVKFEILGGGKPIQIGTQ